MDQTGEIDSTKSFISYQSRRYFGGSFVNNKLSRMRNKYRTLKLANRDFTVVANNCVSGTIYEDLGLQYLTPFVGLYIMPADFVKLCVSFDYYMVQNLKECHRADVDFPVGKLGDVTIYFMHYQTFEVAKEKWERRKLRMNLSNIGFILIQRDGCTKDDMARFDCIENPNKVILTAFKDSGLKSAHYVPRFGELEELGNVLEFEGSFSGKRIMYDFDFIRWINFFSF